MSLVSADLTNATKYLQMLSQLQIELNTTEHISSIATASFLVLASEFNAATDHVAETDPQHFHHVYEWDRIGDSDARLWKNVILGSGRNKIVTWDWRASRTTVPTDHTVEGKPEFTEDFDNRIKQIHIFVWKAPIMEYAIPMHIEPKLSPYLVYPSTPGRAPIFNRHGVTVTHPGGQSEGSFTQWYGVWWNTQAPRIVESLETTQANSFQKALATTTRGKFNLKGKTASITPAINTEARAMAKAVTAGMVKNYIGQAAMRAGAYSLDE